MRPTVRRFEERDLDSVVALALRAWAPVFLSLEQTLGEGLYGRLRPDWRAEQAQAVDAACHDPDLTVWVAELDSDVAGFVTCRLDADSRIGEIHMIAVDPLRQRGGVGSALIDTALAWFTDNGMSVAMVETGGDPGHAPARLAYERNGFTGMPVARYFKEL